MEFLLACQVHHGKARMFLMSFSIGFFTINWYGLVISLSILVSYLFARFYAKYFGLKKETVDDLALILVPIGIIGARIYHVLDRWQYYSHYPLEVFAIWQGGIGIWGALIFGFLACTLYLRARKIAIFPVLDLLVIATVLGQALGRFGNFLNHEAFGPPTNLPTKIYIPPEFRPSGFSGYSFFHPTFFYEAFWDFLVFVLLLFAARKFRKRAGVVFALYLVLYGVGRFFVEFLRIDTWAIGGVKVAQILSSFSVLAGIVLLFSIRRVNGKF